MPNSIDRPRRGRIAHTSMQYFSGWSRFWLAGNLNGAPYFCWFSFDILVSSSYSKAPPAHSAGLTGQGCGRVRGRFWEVFGQGLGRFFGSFLASVSHCDGNVERMQHRSAAQ